MNLKHKYVKCFTKEKSELLSSSGFKFLYEQNGVYYHQNNEDLIVKFSNTNLLKDTKTSSWINL